MIRRILRSTLLSLALLGVVRVSFADPVTPCACPAGGCPTACPAGGCPTQGCAVSCCEESCKTCCRPTVETKSVAKRCYDRELKDVCYPRVHICDCFFKGWHIDRTCEKSCCETPCEPACCEPCHECGRPRVKKILIVKIRRHDECVPKCEAECRPSCPQACCPTACPMSCMPAPTPSVAVPLPQSLPVEVVVPQTAEKIPYQPLPSK